MYRHLRRGVIGRCLLAGAVVLGLQAFLAVAAYAHALDITATAECVEGSVVISFSAGNVPVGTDSHNNIVVTLNGAQSLTGAITANTRFTGTFTVAAAGSVATLVATAVGPWANDGFTGGQTASTTVTIPADCGADGRFTGGGHQIVDLLGFARTAGVTKQVEGVKITRGFTIHCDLLLSNNLEVNWKLDGVAHQFHMTEHLTTVTCFDDPAFPHEPPRSPVDTIEGVGTGRYDGADGYTIEFTLKDGGEPGAGNDKAETPQVPDQTALKIYQTSNPSNVVLEIPLQDITGGNVQSHYDQPHSGNGNK